MTEPKKILTLEEILEGISEIARGGDPAPRLRALQLLQGRESVGVTLPTPRQDHEIVQRLGRLMKGVGPKLTQLAYIEAFPRHKSRVELGSVMKWTDAPADMKDTASRVTSLRLLYKAFPECRVNGNPKGYPVYGSIAEKVSWCRTQAVKCLIERQNRDTQGAHDAMKAVDQTIRDGATEGATDVGREQGLDGPPGSEGTLPAGEETLQEM